MRELNQILSDINAEAEKLSVLYKELALAKGIPVDTADTVPYGGAIVFTLPTYISDRPFISVTNINNTCRFGFMLLCELLDMLVYRQTGVINK